nr:tRNA (N6-isopentenyl adenosine(37)-C2)-methylthiotransferase MiaB [Maliibacterium massiliense]
MHPDTQPHTFSYRIVTYGCQMNEHDSEKLAGMLEMMGGVAAPEQAQQVDVLLYNTCCIREHAEDRVFGNVGALRKQKQAHPEMVIGVCGCMMQQQGAVADFRRRFPFVDILMGTHNMHELPRYLERAWQGERPVCEVWPDEAAGVVEDTPVRRHAGVCAYINIMYGCNNFCSYCIVPYVRGRERSRRMQDVLQEARLLGEQGVREITLLGQNVNSYLGGGDAFAELLCALNEVPGIARIRFMTSHPKDLSESVMRAMASCAHVCPQLHLPVQSGSDRILRAMNRRYTRAHYLELVARLRALIPDIGLSTDIIVGFPGETQEDFDQTRALLEAVDYHSAYLFAYSPRRGTIAADMPDQVPEDVKRARLLEVIDVQNAHTHARNRAYIGRSVAVLVERPAGRAQGHVLGRSACGRTVHFAGNDALIGQIVPVTVTDVTGNTLLGTYKQIIEA